MSPERPGRRSAMAAPQSGRSDGFLTFLKTVQSSQDAGASQTSSAQGSSFGPMAVLATLSKRSPQPVVELVMTSGLPFFDLADALKTCVAANLLRLEGEPGREEVG